MQLPPITKQTLHQIRCELFKRGDFHFIAQVAGKLHEKQYQALTLLADNETTELAYGGAAGGAKSWTGAAWLTYMCECYPETRWFVGRETLKDLRESTFITFSKVFKQYGIEGWRYNGQDHYITFANGSRIDFMELSHRPSDEFYERFGSKEYTGGWIEEAGETTFGAYDTIKTRIGRHLNDKYKLKGKIFITLNPKKNWVHSYFWKPYKTNTLALGVKFLVSLVSDNPFIESEYIEKLNQIKDKVRKQRLLFGNFDYDDDDNMLMSYDAIDDMFNCTGRVKDEGTHCITADVARFGNDESRIYRWKGFLVVERITLKHKKVTEVASEIKKIADKNVIPMSRVIADDDGVGGGVVDILGCKGFVNNSTPLENPKVHLKENYENLKTQCSYMAAECVNKSITGFSEHLVNDDFKERFIEEAEQVKRRDPDSDGKLKIVQKEQVKEFIGRSPDDWDCFMMRQWFELKPKTKWVMEDVEL